MLSTRYKSIYDLFLFDTEAAPAPAILDIMPRNSQQFCNAQYLLLLFFFHASGIICTK